MRVPRAVGAAERARRLGPRGGAGVDAFGVALAKALAQPATALEWCLPLVRPGGAAILWLGPSADLEAVARVSAQLGGGEPEDHAGLIVVPKRTATPPGFPRRTGVAKKRPLPDRRSHVWARPLTEG